MYKVFINDSPIIITSSTKKVNNFPNYLFKEIDIDDIVAKIYAKKLVGVNLYTTNLKTDWKSFTNTFKLIKAAGGLVLNPKKEILFILRNNTWDLPKGWIEIGETLEIAALREVKEECGITNLQLIKPLTTTYHIYHQKTLILKETHWFLMSSDNTNNLKPQLEEGITKAVFKDTKAINNALKNTYANIKLVYDTYKET
ncbi:NUDIX domain-containing protein [uncultured Polaribacter sp.]|uniref:NUDIX hydrolase n=1 Tax=uncultured Polaribacter sp. TaxID=174711 RepID=UPI00262D8C76|nr:NUDIX domain-containing protein [uncultured Polaribacter sp.]